MIRIDRLLSNLGLCSRRKSKEFLTNNILEANKVRIRGIGESVLPSKVTLNGKPLQNPNPLFIALHKPVNYVCSRERDHKNNQIIYDLLPKHFYERKPLLSVAGRLDKYASGLVVLSQDGQFVNRLISPKRHAEREYHIELKHPLKGHEKALFASGEVVLKDEREPLKPAKLDLVDNSRNLVRMILYEGRYHQIRRMLASVHNASVTIHRVRIGNIHLGDLPAGQWRPLSEDEIKGVMAPAKITHKRDFELPPDDRATETQPIQSLTPKQKKQLRKAEKKKNREEQMEQEEEEKSSDEDQGDEQELPSAPAEKKKDKPKKARKSAKAEDLSETPAKRTTKAKIAKESEETAKTTKPTKKKTTAVEPATTTTTKKPRKSVAVVKEPVLMQPVDKKTKQKKRVAAKKSE